MFVEKNLDVCQVEQRGGYTGAAIKMRLKIYKKLWPRCTVCVAHRWRFTRNCSELSRGHSWVVGLLLYGQESRSVAGRRQIEAAGELETLIFIRFLGKLSIFFWYCHIWLLILRFNKGASQLIKFDLPLGWSWYQLCLVPSKLLTNLGCQVVLSTFQRSRVKAG